MRNPRTNFFFLLIFVILGALVLSACGAVPGLGARPTATLIPLPTLGNPSLPIVVPTSPPSGSAEPVGTAPATSTATPLATPTPPFTVTPTTSPTEAATEAPTVAATSTLPPSVVVQSVPTKLPTFTPVPVTAGTTQVKIFLIAENDNGVSGPKIGCGDSVIGVTRVIPATQGILRAALNELLSQHDQFYGQSGLYNALYRAKLNLDSVTLVNGVATVNLSGTMSLGGVCDDPRAEAQLNYTAKQFPTVRSVNWFLNGKPLTFSQK